MTDSIRPKLERVAYAWCHDRELAQDLVQDTWVRALRSVKQLKDKRAGLISRCQVGMEVVVSLQKEYMK